MMTSTMARKRILCRVEISCISASRMSSMPSNPTILSMAPFVRRRAMEVSRLSSRMNLRQICALVWLRAFFMAVDRTVIRHAMIRLPVPPEPGVREEE